MVSDRERISQLEWRINRLERFIGKPGKTTINESINNLNEQVLEHANNSLNARKLVLKAEQVNRLTSPTFQRYLLSDRLAKRELILADEQRIRDITNRLATIDTLAQVLQSDCFREMPKLFAMLNKLRTTHENVKSDHCAFTQELSAFLQDYAAFTLSMDANLQQYKSVLKRNQSHPSAIPDE